MSIEWLSVVGDLSTASHDSSNREPDSAEWHELDGVEHNWRQAVPLAAGQFGIQDHYLLNHDGDLHRGCHWQPIADIIHKENGEENRPTGWGLQQYVYLFLRSLAISDVMASLTGPILWLEIFWDVFQTGWPCKIWRYFATVSPVVTIYNLVAVAFERYNCLCRADSNVQLSRLRQRWSRRLGV